MDRETFLHSLGLLVPFSALMHDDIDNLILLADIFRRNGHEFIHHFVEQLDITTRVGSYPQNKLGHAFFMLQSHVSSTSA